MKIAFVGMSHLGINYALAAAEKGFKVICYDPDLKLIQNLNCGNFPFFEPNIDNLYKKNKNKIQFVSELAFLESCSSIFISLDVKTDINNNSIYFELNSLIKKITNNLKKNKNLILLSQVYPGYTENIAWPKKNLFYQVETLIFGSAVSRALNPEQFIIGTDEKLLINKNYLNYLKIFNCPISIMDYKTAELSKISINLYLISTLSLTNALAEICEKIGTDWKKIMNILYNDKRIGKYAYLKPGLGITSPNLNRDLINIKNLVKKHKINNRLFDTFIKNSNNRKKWVIKILNHILQYSKSSVIGIYGLPYKENISILKNSISISTTRLFKKNKFLLYDPIIKKLPKKISNARICNNFEEIISKVDIIIIMNPWKEVQSKKIISKIKKFKGTYLIDPHNLIKDRDCPRGVKLVKMGKLLNL
jgi:UDPglucose 6-dehydrogenase